MRGTWTKSLALSLGFLVTGARGQDGVWHSQPVRPLAQQTTPVAMLGKPIAVSAPAPGAVSISQVQGPAASLGRPMPLARSAPADSHVQPVAYSSSADPSFPVVRGQAPETITTAPTPITPNGSSAGGMGGIGGQFIWRRADDPVASSPTISAPIVNAPPMGTPILTGPPIPGAPIGSSLFATSAGMDCGHPCGCGCGEGPRMGAVDGCCPPGNRFFVSAEYLLWWLKGDRTPPLVTAGNPIANPTSASIIGAPTTSILYGGHEEGTAARSGVRIGAGYWFSDDHRLGIDVSAFLLPEDRTNFVASSMGNPQLGRPIIDTGPVTVNSAGMVVPNPRFGMENVQEVAAPGVLAGSVDVLRKSTLWGGDANVRSNLLCGNFNLDVLAGFRMLGLDESLAIGESLVATNNQFVTPPGSAPILVVPGGTTFNVNDKFAVTNRFYGGQIGLDGEYHLGSWYVEGKIKLAMGETQEVVNITGSTRIVTPPPFNTTTTAPGGLLALPGTNIGHYVHDTFGFVPEVGLNLGYQFTPNLRGFIGYNMLYWSNVVRVGEQVDRTVNTTFTPGSPVAPIGAPRPMFAASTSDFWAQGVTLGLEFRY